MEEQTIKPNKDLTIPIDNSEADIDQPEQPQPTTNKTSLVNDEEGFKEYAELNLPNIFEMKLGSNVLQAHHLAEIILNCHSIIIKGKSKDKTKESYFG